MSDVSRPRVTVRRFTEADADAVRDLLRTEFVDRSEARLRWQYTGSPDRHLLLGFHEGRLGRILGSVQVPGYVHGQPAILSVVGDWIASPAVRGGGISVVMEKIIFDGLANHDLCLGFPRPEAAAISVDHYGSRHLGTMPQWVRWHEATAVRASRPSAPEALARATAAGLRLRAAATTTARQVLGRQPAVREVATTEAVRAGLDGLADRSRDTAAVIRRRDADHLQWRWLDQPERSWRLLVAESDEGLAGIAVIGLDPHDPSMGRIVDLLALDAVTMTAVVARAAVLLDQAGATRTVCELVDARPWSAAAMRAAGFLARGEGPTMIALKTDRGAIEGEPDGFYLTMGDTDLC